MPRGRPFKEELRRMSLGEVHEWLVWLMWLGIHAMYEDYHEVPWRGAELSIRKRRQERSAALAESQKAWSPAAKKQWRKEQRLWWEARQAVLAELARRGRR